MLKKLMAGTLILPVLLLGACNTIEGTGKDLQSAGKEVEKAADGAK